MYLGHCFATKCAPGMFPDLLMVHSEPSGRDLQAETGRGAPGQIKETFEILCGTCLQTISGFGTTLGAILASWGFPEFLMIPPESARRNLRSRLVPELPEIEEHEYTTNTITRGGQLGALEVLEPILTHNTLNKHGNNVIF